MKIKAIKGEFIDIETDSKIGGFPMDNQAKATKEIETTEERRKRITKATMLKLFKMKHEARIKEHGFDKDEVQYQSIMAREASSGVRITDHTK